MQSILLGSAYASVFGAGGIWIEERVSTKRAMLEVVEAEWGEAAGS